MKKEEREEIKRVATQRRFAKRQKRLMMNLIHQMQKDLLENLDKAIQIGVIPESWTTTNGDERAVKAIIDSYCRDRPCLAENSEDQLECDNIHLCI